MTNLDDTQLESLEIGPMPIIQTFVDRLDLPRMLNTYLPRHRRGRDPKLAPEKVITAMIANIVVARRPLYGIHEWAQGFVPEPFGLEATDVPLLNDDRLGRELDRMFEADRASLMTAVITKAVTEFDVSLEQLHSDTTTVTFSGAYDNQTDLDAPGRPPCITFGRNKDHRPDLKQLVYALTVSADGAVPIHHKTYDGNTSDDKVHIETWSMLEKIVGSPDFLYVADSKLCTRENMQFIAERGGRFISVVPRTRKEYTTLCERLRQGEVFAWDEVCRKPNPRGQDKDEVVYWAIEGDHSVEGYRILWYRSSQKTVKDASVRQARIDKAKRGIERLQNREGTRPFPTQEAAQKAADAVLRKENAERWLRVQVQVHSGCRYKQTTPGRPSEHTTYVKEPIEFFGFEVTEDGDAIQADARLDGLFPLITNDRTLCAKEVLAKYKYQPNLEKRNEQLKSVYHVMPILLKSPTRVAGLLFVYFLALLLWALIEREIRRRMDQEGIEHLPLYPEMRKCEAPTTDGIFQTLQGLRRHRLLDKDGNVLRTFFDPLSPVAAQALKLLGVSLQHYGRRK